MSVLDLSKLFGKAVQRVSLFGYGRSAKALLPHLLNSGYCVTVRDDGVIKSEDIPKGVRSLSGKESLSSLTDDVMIISPSVRRDRFYSLRLDKTTILTSDCDIFFKSFSGKSFAVSGSSGKSTTSSILHALLSSNAKWHLIGNIGVPMTHTLLTEKPTRAVCEISSFNLQYDQITPSRATITNIKRNHLNWHKNFDEYKKAKLSLLMSSADFSVNVDDDAMKDLANKSSCYACYSLIFDYNSLHNNYKDKIIFTRSKDGIMRNDMLVIPDRIIGGYPRYNLYNLLSALSLAEGEADLKSVPDVIAGYRFLSHRCEQVIVSSGVRVLDSSIDTSPDRTYETLSALTEPIVLLLGGRSKGESYSSLASIINSKCKSVFTFGEAAEKIATELSGVRVPISLHKTMRDATLSALTSAVAGDTLLLSPASTSYDEFSSFEERGDIFKKITKDALGQKNTGEKNEKNH